MKKRDRQDLHFMLYMLTIIVLAVIYFSVPERAVFFDFQMRWWNEMIEVVRSFFQM
jgi:hypothetical protein